MLTRSDIARAFNMLRNAGLRPPPDIVADAATAADTYAIVLDGMTEDRLLLAVVSHIRSGSKFWPTAGELLHAVPSEKPEQLGWGEAYGILNDFARVRSTAYGSPPDRFHSDEAVDAGIRAGLAALGGWRAFGMLDEEDEGTARAHFRDTYNAVMRRVANGNAHRQLTQTLARAGLIESRPIAGTGFVRLVESEES